MKYQIITIICIGVVLWFSIIPVEIHWCDTDIRFTEAICAVSAVAILMVLQRRHRFIPSSIDAIVSLSIVYVMVRAYVDSTYPCANFILRFMQMLSLYVSFRLLFSSAPVSEKMIVFIILFCAIYEAYLGANQLIKGYSRHHLFAMTGSFLNPGPYSIFLGLGMVMSCYIKQKYDSGKDVFSSLMTYLPLIFLILLPATWSRAALLSAAICLGIIYWEKWKRWKWQAALSIVAILMGLYFLKKGSADGRSVIYMISLLCIQQHPLFGSGIGSFCHQYAEGMEIFSLQHPAFDFHHADVTSNAFNILLQISVEQGIVGLCLAIVLVVLILIKLFKKGGVLGMGLLCLLLFSMFSYPFELLPYQIIFVLSAAYAATDKAECAISAGWHEYYRHCILPMALFCVVVLSSVFTYKQMKERIQAETDYQLMAGSRHVAFIDDYYELLPLLNCNKRFLFDFAKILATDGRYVDSNAMLRLGTLVSNDPMFYVLQGNNYCEMMLFDEAEKAYKKAFAIMPNRLYPLYQLMLLYEKREQRELMVQMAQQVARFTEKVTSPATEEMKKKAREILSKN